LTPGFQANPNLVVPFIDFPPEAEFPGPQVKQTELPVPAANKPPEQEVQLPEASELEYFPPGQSKQLEDPETALVPMVHWTQTDALYVVEYNPLVQSQHFVKGVQKYCPGVQIKPVTRVMNIIVNRNTRTWGTSL
jgi:hypothetical protein